jgi:ABC-type glycerol-3-phosphate transport system permease component
MVLKQDMSIRSSIIALATLLSRYTGNPTFQFAGLGKSATPVLLVYTFFQKFITEGLNVGSIK